MSPGSGDFLFVRPGRQRFDLNFENSSSTFHEVHVSSYGFCSASFGLRIILFWPALPFKTPPDVQHALRPPSLNMGSAAPPFPIGPPAAELKHWLDQGLMWARPYLELPHQCPPIQTRGGRLGGYNNKLYIYSNPTPSGPEKPFLRTCRTAEW